MREEAAGGESQVVGQPRALDAVAEELLARGEAGGRHVGEEDPPARIARGERFDERRRGARLAHGDRVDPDAPRRRGGGVEAEALAEAIEVAALPARAPGEARDEQRGREGPPQPLQEAHHPSPPPNLIPPPTPSPPPPLPPPPPFP